MLPVQARLLEVARALRYGSNARLIVLRATQDGMANLLKQVPRQPSTPTMKPTVLPARPAPAGMPDAGLARNAETLLAGQTATLVAQAYVEAGARPGLTGPGVTGESSRDGMGPASLPVAGDSSTPVQSFDPRGVSLPGQLSRIIDHEDDELRPSERRRKALAVSGSGGDRGDASPLVDRRVVFVALGGLCAALLVGLIKALF